MFAWTWRLTVLGSFAGCVVLGWGWLRSHSRSEALYANPPGHYVMALSHLGRVTFFHMKDFPGAEGERASFGHTGAGAADDSLRQLQGGATIFDLSPTSENSYGLLVISEGTAQANVESPRAEGRRPPAPPTQPVVVKRPPVAKIALPRGPGSITLTRHPTTGRASPAAAAPKPVVTKAPAASARSTTRPAFAYLAVSVPHWLGILVLSLPGLLYVAVAWRRVRVLMGRRLRGECVKCGADRKWDLGHRCSVCGTPD